MQRRVCVWYILEIGISNDWLGHFEIREKAYVCGDFYFQILFETLEDPILFPMWMFVNFQIWTKVHCCFGHLGNQKTFHKFDNREILTCSILCVEHVQFETQKSFITLGTFEFWSMSKVVMGFEFENGLGFSIEEFGFELHQKNGLALQGCHVSEDSA